MKKNRGVWRIFFICILASFAVNGFESNDASEKDLRFELIDYSPSPVVAGERFEVSISVTNIKEDPVENLRVNFGERFPISVVDKKEIFIGDLQPGEKRTFSKTFVASPHARNDGEIVYQFNRKEFSWSSSGVFSIEISSRDKDVEFDSIRTVPEKLRQGTKGKIIVDFQNSASTTLNEITLKLNISSPFTITGSTNEKRIRSLPSKKTSSVEFEVFVDPEADTGIYSLPLDLTYYDSLRNLFSKSVSIGVVIDSPPEYAVFVEESDALQYGSNPTITIALSNIGNSDLKFVTMEVLDTKDYSVISNTKSYMGNLEPDDFETARFDLNLKNCIRCGKELPIKLKLNFKDAFNNDVVDELTIYEKAYTKNTAVALGLVERKSGIVNLLIYLIIISFIYLTYKEYRRTKDIVYSLRNALKDLAIGILKIVLNVSRKFRWGYIKRIPIKIRMFLNKIR